MDSEPAARAPPAWRSARSPLFAEESYLGGINVLDPRQALHLPCRVTGLTVQGNERTRREMIEREMRAAMGARTHAELAAGASVRSAGGRPCGRRVGEALRAGNFACRSRAPRASVRLPPLPRALRPRLRAWDRRRAAVSRRILSPVFCPPRSVQSCSMPKAVSTTWTCSARRPATLMLASATR